jgi:hypothetical protein
MMRTGLGPLLFLCACGSGLKQAKVQVEEEWVSTSGGDILGIVVTPDEVIVPVGTTIQLEALGLKDTRETVELTDAVDWSSSSPSVAAISNSLSNEGTLTGVSSGVSTIVADFGGLGSAPARITVTDAGLERLAITPGSLTVGLWDTVQLSAEATFSDGSSSDASGQVRWITADGSIVQLSGDGELEGAGLGLTTVTVEWNGVVSDPVSVEVIDEVQVSEVDLYYDWVVGVVDDGNFEVMVSIFNDSDTVVSDIWLDLFVDPGYTPVIGDWPDWYHQIEYLGAGESTTVTMSASTDASSHDFALLLDSLDTVTELNESNNLYEGSTEDEGGSAGGGSTGGGDDALSNLSITYVGGYSDGSQTEYWIDVTNSGEGFAGAFYVDVFHDAALSDEPELYSDGDAYQFVEDGLSAGETTYITLVVEEPCDDCSAWVMVDGYNMVVEADESDNTVYYDGS